MEISGNIGPGLTGTREDKGNVSPVVGSWGLQRLEIFDIKTSIKQRENPIQFNIAQWTVRHIKGRVQSKCIVSSKTPTRDFTFWIYWAKEL